MRIVADEGFGGLTVTRIAAELDVSVGAMYRYFNGKQALVAELQARGLTMIRRGFEERRAAWRRDLPADERCAALCELMAAARYYLVLAEEQPVLSRWIGASLSEKHKLDADVAAERVAPGFSELLAAVSELFARAAKVGALSEGHALERTVIFWSSLQGITAAQKLARLAPGDWYATRELGGELTRTLLTGWGADREAIARADAWLETKS